MKGVRVTYIVDHPGMTDAEYEDQEEQIYIISEDKLKGIIERELPLKSGQSIVWTDSSIDAIK